MNQWIKNNIKNDSLNRNMGDMENRTRREAEDYQVSIFYKSIWC